MVYLEDIENGTIRVTIDKEAAGHFQYQDQSNLCEIDLITELLTIHTGHAWGNMIDEQDEDRRHVIFEKNNL